MIDKYGEYFSDGVEVVTRTIGTCLEFVMLLCGGACMLLCMALLSPIAFVGWCARKYGFKPEWHR